MFADCKKPLLFRLLIVAVLLFTAFKLAAVPMFNYKWIRDCLSCRFDGSSSKVKLKKWDLNITEDGFFRLRKYFVNGKQEYFSFNIRRFSDLDYLGTASSGELMIKTQSDDIIVQTYNDPRGNIDSMAAELKIPVLRMEAELLDSLRSNLAVLSDK